MKKREIRSLKVRELRATKTDDGKQYLEGRAASYNVLSEDFGYWQERIIPGAFTRALTEKQDVRHLINHDPSLVLGRTAAGTLELAEDDKGLTFRTLLPDTSYARDLAVSVERGDINECSFGFMALNTAWVEEVDPENDKQMLYIRELRDLDLFDISTVTYPAYPSTDTEINSRSLPTDAPAEFRSKLQLRGAACQCTCADCQDGDCADCSNPDCVDENCRCSDMRAARWKATAEMRLRITKSLQ
jgi:HK97 family phage prohead protease